jgi:RinA family phage transcriptional activator
MEYSMPAIEGLLSNYPFISEDIKKLEDELRDLITSRNEFIEVLKAAAPTGMPQSRQLSDPTLQVVITIVDIKNKEINNIYLKLKRLYDEQSTVKTLLAQLTREERYVIEARYFQKQKPISWSKIAKAICFDKRSCYRIRSRALKKMASQF